MTADAVTVLRRAARNKPFDELQARWDCDAIVAEYPRRKKVSHKSASPARVMAELAGEVYHHHTGKFPGRAITSKGIAGGHYPEFVRALLASARVSCTDATLFSACREAEKKLNARAGLDKLRKTIRGQEHPLNAERNYRDNRRAHKLEQHVAGELESGFIILDGYEPARDPATRVAWHFNAAARRKLGLTG